MKERKSARAFVINEKKQILLQKFEFPQVKGNKVLWVTPGGRVKKYESYKKALKRELLEELGVQIRIKGRAVLVKDVLIDGKSGKFNSYERYYIVKLRTDNEFSSINMSDNEKDTFQGLKWWHSKELEQIEDFAPKEIIGILNSLQ